MTFTDYSRFALESVLAQRSRSLLTALGIAVGIAAVVLLTSIGEGIQRYVLAEFTQFGTRLVAITPGRNSTLGISGAVVNSVRPLSLEDAEAIEKLPGIAKAVPFVQGNAAIEADRHSRRSMVFGVGSGVPEVWQMAPIMGRFLPADSQRQARPFAVLGHKVWQELFKGRNPLGERIRIASERYRVIGVMQRKGTMLGFDLDDAVYIPTQRAMSLFNQQGLMELDLLPTPGAGDIGKSVKRLLIERHGSEDFTLTTQDQMLDSLGSVLDILTLAVGALGGISLLVGGVGILTIMTISVNERSAEVGLLRALGAGRLQILWLFLGEAVLLSGLGGACGLLLGGGGAWLLGELISQLPTHTPWLYALGAELMALLIGLVAGVAPAWRAAGLDPVEALRSE